MQLTSTNYQDLQAAVNLKSALTKAQNRTWDMSDDTNISKPVSSPSPKDIASPASQPKMTNLTSKDQNVSNPKPVLFDTAERLIFIFFSRIFHLDRTNYADFMFAFIIITVLIISLIVVTLF